MDSQDVERAENLRCVYEQNWLHARHVENERLWFTNIYAVVMAGSLALMSEAGLIWPLATFLFILSLLGFVMCHALRIAFIRHSRMADIISRREWRFRDYSIFYQRTARPGEKTEKSGERRKEFSFKDVFYYWYMLGTSVSATLFVPADTDTHILSRLLVGGLVFAVLFLVRKYWFQKVEKKLHMEMSQIDREA